MKPKRAADVFDIEIGGESLVVISLPAESLDDVSELTRAEREVAAAAVAGLSNAEIAKQRKRATRTIANQLAAIYRKLGVTSRTELALRMARRR